METSCLLTRYHRVERCYVGHWGRKVINELILCSNMHVGIMTYQARCAHRSNSDRTVIRVTNCF